MAGWRYYFPEDGETADDARELQTRRSIKGAEDAALYACELDFARHDGWERGEDQFVIVILSPDGDESRFCAWHEQSVVHRVSETV